MYSFEFFSSDSSISVYHLITCSVIRWWRWRRHLYVEFVHGSPRWHDGRRAAVTLASSGVEGGMKANNIEFKYILRVVGTRGAQKFTSLMRTSTPSHIFGARRQWCKCVMFSFLFSFFFLWGFFDFDAVLWAGWAVRVLGTKLLAGEELGLRSPHVLARTHARTLMLARTHARLLVLAACSPTILPGSEALF